MPTSSDALKALSKMGLWKIGLSTCIAPPASIAPAWSRHGAVRRETCCVILSWRVRVLDVPPGNELQAGKACKLCKRTGVVVLGPFEGRIVLRALEPGQHVLRAPALEAPAVVVLRCAAVVQRRVGARAAAQKLAARDVRAHIAHGLALLRRLEVPVQKGVLEEPRDARRHL